MSTFDVDDNFTIKTFDKGGRSAWPLPPYCVFKCRDAKPWINPELFYIAPNSNHNTGVMIVGDIAEQEKEAYLKQKAFPPISEEPEAIYAESVDVYGLPLPNTKIKLIEYSANPEKGIDTGDSANNLDALPGNRFTRKGAIKDRSKSGSEKKRRWAPFQKEKNQSWRIFY